MTDKETERKVPCRWEPTCDDDCRRPYGKCPKNCKSYKPYISIEELERQIESYKALDSHYDEIEEDAKRIAEENERLKERIREKLKMTVIIANIGVIQELNNLL